MAVWRIRGGLNGRLSLLEQVRKTRGYDDISYKEAELPNLKEAVAAIKESIEAKERIAVFGDYDCDGICGALIMKEALKKAGADVTVVLPTRREGYGIKARHVKELKERGIRTIITVDNGVAAYEAAEAAKELGIRMVVTDHHEPKNTLPQCIVVDPKLHSDDVFRDYAGAVVAYKVGEALLDSMGLSMDGRLKVYASLATVVDMMPVVGPNHRLAREGLLIMRESPPVGIKALMDAAGTKILNGYSFGWQLGPRINAAGRMSDPRIAYKLLATDDYYEAAKLAGVLERMNRERQEIIEKAVEECMSKYDGSMFPFFVVGYPQGVAGVVAGQVAGIIKRPVLVGSEQGGVVKASGRSVGEFSILDALHEAKARCGLPEVYGGHRKACGLEVSIKDVGRLQAVLEEIARERLTLEDMTEWLDIEGVITSAVTPDEVEELDELEPSGESNPEPVFLYKGVVEQVRIGEGWKLVRTGGLKFFTDDGIGIDEGKTIYAAVTPQVNEYNGGREVMLRVHEVRERVYTREYLLNVYAKWKNGTHVNDGNIRDIFAELGLSRAANTNGRRNLLESETFRKYGAVLL
ncbi:single-stranded-DNA-specific exonuclease RecJ [Fervidicola ferrireducens]|uniref:single-stranded-DNA-specific exonuclease RecJ n=1 Tax=Fervidicola ferrireducens TaxID=520764 RepID=UPI00082DDDE2|nr:DHH family phosphoesterase [Fervidicola ferrireducens]